MSLKVFTCLPAIGLLLLVQLQLKGQQSMCSPVSSNPLVMEALCSDIPRPPSLPAKQMSATTAAQSVLALTAEEINRARLHDAPPIRMGDLLVFEANRRDFIFEIQLSNGRKLVLGPWTQTGAKDAVANWGKVRGRLDYPETLGWSIVNMKITPVYPEGPQPLLRGIKIDRLGEYVFELERVHPVPATQTMEPPMSYPQDPRVMPASITRPNPFRPEPQTGFLATRLPALSLRPMMFQSGGATDGNHYKYTGKEFDNESGLYNFGARYYSPAVGRYLSPDWSAQPVPIPYAIFSNPQSLNLYTYGKNNPTTFIDMDGHDPGDKFKSKIAAAADAVRYIRKQENGYKWEYGTRIEKAGKDYSSKEPVTQKKPTGVDLPPLQKNDVGDIHTHNYGVGHDTQANSIEQPDRIGTVQDKDKVQKMQDDPKTNVDYKSYVGAPNGDLVQFTPNPNAPDGLGDAKTVEHNVAPDPNPPKAPAQQPTPMPKKEEPK